jgi:hypothetical protein
MLEAGRSTVVTYAADGVSQARYLGQLGHVNQVKYSWSYPGGPDQLTCLLQREALFRTDALNPGRIVKVNRGGRVIWEGKLDEPSPSPDGWTLTAHGAGTYGADFAAVYTTWANNPNDAVNAAITRGLRWYNPGAGLSGTGLWYGQVSDSGSQQITDLLNLLTTKGNEAWYVKVTPVGNLITLTTIPTIPMTPDRLLVSSSPVPRTLGGDVNVIYVRYQSAGDGGAAAVYSLTSVSQAASVAEHGEIEAYVDISSAGTLSSGAAQAAAQSVLNRYQRASFAGPFVCRYGEVLTVGGQPVDIGCEDANHVYKVILTDYGYGGEVIPDPLVFLSGEAEYDDATETISITPFQSLDLSMTGLLSALSTTYTRKRRTVAHRTSVGKQGPRGY